MLHSSLYLPLIITPKSSKPINLRKPYSSSSLPVPLPPQIQKHYTTTTLYHHSKKRLSLFCPMDSATEIPIPIYETLTLTPLSPPPSAAGTATPRSSPWWDPFEQCTVFRNEISVSALHSTATDSAAPDFFSLDVEDEAELKMPRGEGAELKTLRLADGKAEPEKVPEPRLESGWFRGNSRFKSPMLQLHKGKYEEIFG